MSRLADVPLATRMQEVVRLCRETDNPDERVEFFLLGLYGYLPSGEEVERLASLAEEAADDWEEEAA